MKKNNIIQITVVSAATIITFTGATLVIPRAAKAEDLIPSQTQVQSFEEIITSEPRAHKKYDHFSKFHENGIRNHAKRFEKWNHNNEVLEYLGITRTEALEARMNGKSFKDIALEKGLDVEEVANIFEDNLVEKLNKKVADGKLSTQRYEKIVSNLDELKQKFIEGDFN